MVKYLVSKGYQPAFAKAMAGKSGKVNHLITDRSWLKTLL